MWKIFKKKLIVPTTVVNSETQSDAEKKNAEAYKLIKEGQKIYRETISERLQTKRNIAMDKTFDTLIKMSTLANIMTSTYTSDSNLPGNKLFNEEELFEYKDKMSKLLKKL